MQVVKDLITSFDIINSTDHQGNTALHTAAYRGQPVVVEALIRACPSLISLKNSAGENFLHSAVSGFQTPAFRRLDRQAKLMKQLSSGQIFNMEDIINAKNNDGRTGLHMAIIGNVHSDLVQLLMSAPSINVNVRDNDGMTPLDLLKQRPQSASSDILIRHLISAGGMLGCQDYSARRAIASHLKMQGNGSSPGTSFRISDAEIFLYTGIDVSSDGNADPGSGGMSSSSTELTQSDPTSEHQSSSVDKKPVGSVNIAAQRLKSVFHWPKPKEKKPERFKKSVDEGSVESYKKGNTPDEPPTPLRQRFSKPSSLPNNKRTLSVRSNQSSPTAKKRFATGIMHGVMHAMPQLTVPGRSRSSSFSKSSIASSPNSLDKQKGIFIDNEVAGPSCANQLFDDETPNNTVEKQGSKRMKSQYFCFGGSSLSVKTPVSRQRQNQNVNPSIISMA